METHQELQVSGLWPLLERSFDGVVLLAPAPWQVARANAEAVRILGTVERDLVGRRAVELFDDASRKTTMEMVQRAWVGEVCDESISASFVDDAGEARRVELRATSVTIEGDRFVGLVFRSAGGVDRAASWEVGRVDPLTGLHDRDFLTARLSSLLHDSLNSDHKFAVLFVDLDNFKAVNDRFGHVVGDRVLREAARRLAACVGKQEVARYGGDEFVVVDTDLAAERPEELAERIRTAMTPLIEVEDGTVVLSASVGIAVASAEIRTPEELIAAADRAMYAAKRTGK